MSPSPASAPTSVLEAPLPARWGRLQRLKNTIIYHAIRFGFWWVRLIPFPIGQAVARALVKLAPWVAIKETRRARAQLRDAFPQWDDAKIEVTVRQMYDQLARSAAEIAHIDRFVTGADAIEFPEDVRAIYEAALAQDKGAVFITGHIGNWELFAQVVAAQGFPVSCVAKPLYDPRLTRWVHTLRSTHGLQLIWRGDASGWRELIRTFRDGRILALLIDQDTRVQGVFVPFFGKPAHTPSGAAAMALRSEVPVVVTWMHREEGIHRVYARQLNYEVTGDKEQDVQDLTASMTLELENAIRQRPEQWVWLHARWKTVDSAAGPVQ